MRRRAALAVGRVGLREGVPPLAALLSDADAEVRQMAAFALGLIGDRSAGEPLVAALADPSLLVKGSAAEALGLMGDRQLRTPLRSCSHRQRCVANPRRQADAQRYSPGGAFQRRFALVR